MPESTRNKNMRDGILDILVGGQSYRVKYQQGNLSYTVPGPSIANYLDRGQFAEDEGEAPSLRYDQDQACTGSFTAYLRDLSDDSYVTLHEFIAKCGQYMAAWGTALGNDQEVKTVTLKWTVKGARHGDGADHTVTFPHTILTGSVAEGSPSQITTNFTSYTLYPVVT